MAVYDLIGQASGLPVSRLFGNKPKRRIVQTWWSQCLPPDVMASEAKLGYEFGLSGPQGEGAAVRRSC